MSTVRDHTSLLLRELSDKVVATQSFFKLFEQYRAMLYAISLQMLGQGEDAKDAVQETFIKAYTHLDILRDTMAIGEVKFMN